MSEPEIFELLKPKIVSDVSDRQLQEIKQKIEELQSVTAPAKAYPMTLVDSSRLEEIVLAVCSSYLQALETLAEKPKNPELQEAMLVFRQTTDKFQQVLDSIVDIAFFVRKLDKNADLERQVLERINRELG